jgi:hypothetical protein
MNAGNEVLMPLMRCVEFARPVTFFLISESLVKDLDNSIPVCCYHPNKIYVTNIVNFVELFRYV